MLVGAGDHEDVVAGHPHVPAEDVGGHAETGHVADVARAVGIRPGDGGQDMTHAQKPSEAGPAGFRWSDLATGERRDPVVRVRVGRRRLLGREDRRAVVGGQSRLHEREAALRDGGVQLARR